MSRIALLDVNVLIALFNPDHVHHDLAHDWFADHRRHGWATCPSTELGFVRVLSNPSSGTETWRAAELVARLRRFCESDEHTFWNEDLSLLDEARVKPAFISGHRQLTDVYLLAVAVKNGGCLATFDRSIPVSAVVGATREALHVITPA